MASAWIRVALGIFLLAFVVVGCSFSLAGDGDGAFGSRDAAAFGDGARAELFIVSTTSLTMVEAQPGQPRAKVEFNVRLAQAPAADVVVPAAITPTGRLTIAPSSLLFTPDNWATAQTFSIDADTNAEIDPPRFKVALGPATSTDSLFSGADPADVTIEFTDTNEAIAIEPRLTGNKHLQVSEKRTTARFQVWLNKIPTGDVDVTCTSARETEVELALDTSSGVVGDAGEVDASADLPFAKSVTLFFPKNTPVGQLKTVVARGVDDLAADYTQEVAVTCVSQSTQDLIFEGRTAAPYFIDNVDDDTASVLFSTTQVTTGEGQAPATFTITLSTEPAQPPVEFDIQSSNPTQGTVTQTVTIDKTNWSTGVVVTVTPTDDAIADGVQTAELTLTMRTADPAYAAVASTLPKVLVTYGDDESAAVLVSKTNANTTEGGGTDSFTVTLSAQPTSDVYLVVSNSRADEVNLVSPAGATFVLNGANWNVGQVVNVQGRDDQYADGPQTATLTVAVDGTVAQQNPVYLAAPAAAKSKTVAVSNADNDVAGVTTSPALITLMEGGSAGSFSVHLNARPVSPVSVTLTPNPPLVGATVSPSSRTLTFDTNNWSTDQTANFLIPEDCYYGNTSISVTVAVNAGSDPAYLGAATPDVSISHLDNEPTPSITVTPTTITTIKNGTDQTFTIELSTRPRTNVTIPLSIAAADNTKGSISPSSVTFSAFDTTCPPDAEVVTISPGNATGTYTIAVSADTSIFTDVDYRNRNPSDVVVTNNN